MYAVTPVPFTSKSSLFPFTPLSSYSRCPRNAFFLMSIPPETAKFAFAPDFPMIHPPPVTRSPCSLHGGAPATPPAQPVTTVPSVNVTSALAQAFPLKVPPVMVMAAPARMFPWKVEVVMVAAASTHHVTLHACAPPAMTTWKLVPVRAPDGALIIQVPFAGPVSVNVPVFASELTQ